VDLRHAELAFNNSERIAAVFFDHPFDATSRTSRP
jgi:hypothetical protein